MPNASFFDGSLELKRRTHSNEGSVSIMGGMQNAAIEANETEVRLGALVAAWVCAAMIDVVIDVWTK